MCRRASPLQSPRRRAERLAAGYGQDFIGTEHLLLALALDPDGIVGLVLDELGVRDETQVRLETIIESPAYNGIGGSTPIDR